MIHRVFHRVSFPLDIANSSKHLPEDILNSVDPIPASCIVAFDKILQFYLDLINYFIDCLETSVHPLMVLVVLVIE